MYSKSHKLRLSSFLLFSIFLLIVLLARLYYIQIVKFDSFSKIALNQQDITINISPQRGVIYDRTLKELAISLKVYSAWANPRLIKDKTRAADRVSDILDLDSSLVLERLNKNKSFVWLKRMISEPELNGLNDSQIKGVYLLAESKRFYPKGKLASHLLGFCGLDGYGLEGVELSYDNFLRGAVGWRYTLQDGRGKEITTMEKELMPTINGRNLILTIDEIIQYIAEEELLQAVDKWKAVSGTIIIMEPSTGKILALANYPTFNPNFFSNTKPRFWRNRAITDCFEPGSTFKIVTASAALEEGLLNLDDKFYCEEGAYKIGKRILHDYHPYGWLTFKEVIVKSSNIGTVKVAREVLGGERLQRYIKRFGFGEKTGIDLPGEIVGIAKDPSQWSGTTLSAIPIGQEIAVTALQLASAVSCIANGGLLIKPRVVGEIRDEDFKVVRSFKPEVIRRLLSEKVAAQMRSILKGVVEKGTGRLAGLNGYTAAGKTGTAQKARLDGKGYFRRKFVASFIGFAPVREPAISVVVILDEPRPVHFGGVVCAPVFKKVAEKILSYLEIRPDETG
ncbi:MAG: penicillin-binding transpeptidase domain-containing protein [Candidatus Omnitrophota bacterium]|nr:penicillin-binding transpeptidase domain-containing protein [Candidatus Omnitrophota bacterium]